MNNKLHYIVTFSALFFLGLIIQNPGPTPTQNAERECKIVKGKMDCFYKYTENRINKNSEVQYKLN
jgi:hypothetical protein